ncbi:MAG: LysM peptidoglycan-binding domain-containing protein [Candidatus Omnitrophota bacterium]
MPIDSAVKPSASPRGEPQNDKFKAFRNRPKDTMRVLSRVVSVCLVLLLFSQQIAWAEVINLKEQGDLTDYSVAVISGAISTHAIKPGWGEIEAFTYTYAIPKASDWAIRKGTGFKGKTAELASTVLSTYAVSGIDYSRAAQDTAQRATQKASNIFVRMWTGTKKYLTDLFANKKDICTGALIDSLNAGAMMAAKREIIEELDDSDDEKKIGELLGLAGAYGVGIGMRWGLQATIGDYLGYDPEVGPVVLKPGEKQETIVYYVDENGGLVSKKVNNLDEMAFIQEELPGELFLGYIPPPNAPKDAQELARDLVSGGAGSTDGPKVGPTIEALRDKLINGRKLDRVLPTLKIKGEDGNSRPIIAIKAIPRPITVFDGKTGRWVTKNFKDALWDQTVDTGRRALPVLVRSAIEVAAGLLGAKRELAVLLSSGATGGLFGRNTSWWKGVLGGLGKGVISAGLLHLSRQTKSPVHGAIINIGASSLLQFAAVTEPLKETQAGQNQKPEDMDLSRKTTDLALEEGQSRDFGLLKEFISTSIAYANADLYSFGRAQPLFKYENGERTFGFNWTSGNDALFLARYIDYIKDVRKDGLFPALMNQFVSSYHNQAVENVHGVLSGDISRAEYVKRHAPYIERAEADRQRRLSQEDLIEILVEKSKEVLSQGNFENPSNIAKFKKLQEEPESKLSDQDKEFIEDYKRLSDINDSKTKLMQAMNLDVVQEELSKFNLKYGTNFTSLQQLRSEAVKLENQLDEDKAIVLTDQKRELLNTYSQLEEIAASGMIKQFANRETSRDAAGVAGGGLNFVNPYAIALVFSSNEFSGKSHDKTMAARDEEILGLVNLLKPGKVNIGGQDFRVNSEGDLTTVEYREVENTRLKGSVYPRIINSGGHSFISVGGGTLAKEKAAIIDDKVIWELDSISKDGTRAVWKNDKGEFLDSQSHPELNDLLGKQAALNDLKRTNQTYANVYTKLNEDVTMIESSSGWQRLDMIHGRPYVSVPERLKNKNMVKADISTEMSEEAVKTSYEYWINRNDAKEITAKEIDGKVGTIKKVLSAYPDSLPLSEIEKLQPILKEHPALTGVPPTEITREDLESVIDHINSFAFRNKAYKQADQRAYKQTEADLSQKYNLTGVADYRDVYGNNPSYYSHWDKTPMPEPAAAPAPKIPIDNNVIVRTSNLNMVNLGFRFDKDKMTEDNRKELKAKIDELRKIDPGFKNVAVEIPLQSGTDTYSDIENPPHNVHLGLGRTNTIRDFLIGQGVPDQNIKIVNNEIPLKVEKTDIFGRQNDRTSNIKFGFTTEQVVKESALTSQQRQSLQDVSGTKVLQQAMPPRIISLPSELKFVDHIVQSGETIESIASGYNNNPAYFNKGLTTSSTRIMDLNKITDATKLRPRQVIKVPIE